jgi:hypothetical protein
MCVCVISFNYPRFAESKESTNENYADRRYDELIYRITLFVLGEREREREVLCHSLTAAAWLSQGVLLRLTPSSVSLITTKIPPCHRYGTTKG